MGLVLVGSAMKKPSLPAALAALLVDAKHERERAQRESITPRPQRPRCGARTRSGKPCQAPAVWDRIRNRARNGRCRMHGGNCDPDSPKTRVESEGCKAHDQAGHADV